MIIKTKLKENNEKCNCIDCFCDRFLNDISYEDYTQDIQKHGIRTVERFLIFPKNINGEIRWLERAKWIEYKIFDIVWTTYIHGNGSIDQREDVERWIAYNWDIL